MAVVIRLQAFNHLSKHTLDSSIGDIYSRWAYPFESVADVISILPNVIFCSSENMLKLQEFSLWLNNIASITRDKFLPLPIKPDNAEEKNKQQRTYGFRFNNKNYELPHVTPNGVLLNDLIKLIRVAIKDAGIDGDFYHVHGLCDQSLIFLTAGQYRLLNARFSNLVEPL